MAEEHKKKDIYNILLKSIQNNNNNISKEDIKERFKELDFHIEDYSTLKLYKGKTVKEFLNKVGDKTKIILFEDCTGCIYKDDENTKCIFTIDRDEMARKYEKEKIIYIDIKLVYINNNYNENFDFKKIEIVFEIIINGDNRIANIIKYCEGIKL
jgi:hypothetical protein